MRMCAYKYGSLKTNMILIVLALTLFLCLPLHGYSLTYFPTYALPYYEQTGNLITEITGGGARGRRSSSPSFMLPPESNVNNKRPNMAYWRKEIMAITPGPFLIRLAFQYRKVYYCHYRFILTLFYI